MREEVPYAQLSRKKRRMMRRAGLAEPSPLLAQPRRFTDPSPERAYPETLFWWDRPFQTAAHIFTHCPRLFREWAGRDFRVIRSGSVRQAARHTDGLCRFCLLGWQFGRTA